MCILLMIETVHGSLYLAADQRMCILLMMHSSRFTLLNSWPKNVYTFENRDSSLFT